MSASITVVGFPKCGTSALMRKLNEDSRVDLLLDPSGRLEVSWPAIKEIEAQQGAPKAGRIRAHKFTAYIYSPASLSYLEGSEPQRKFVLCIRDPLKALMSWHKMHMDIATSGKHPQHFAWKERNFYAECSIVDYYARFGRERLCYDKHIERLLGIVAPERTIIVRQEGMARDIAAVAQACLDLAGGTTVVAARSRQEEKQVHLGYADRAEVAVAEEIRDELHAVAARMDAIVRTSGAHLLL